MRKLSGIFLFLSCVVTLTGCSIRQDVQPIASQPEEEVCIIEDPAVRAGFIEAYKKVLLQRGYTVRVLPKGSDLRACPLTTTYIGHWKWDLANYLAQARIEVFRDGRRVGQAEYDSRSGGANLKKFVNGEEKVTEMVQLLYPNRAGTSGAGTAGSANPAAPAGK